MSCKHLDGNKCKIKNKTVDKFDCNKCLLKLEDYSSNFNGFDFKGTIFEDLFKNK